MCMQMLFAESLLKHLDSPRILYYPMCHSNVFHLLSYEDSQHNCYLIIVVTLAIYKYNIMFYILVDGDEEINNNPAKF